MKKQQPIKFRNPKTNYQREVTWFCAESRNPAGDDIGPFDTEPEAIAAAYEQDYAYVVRTEILFYAGEPWETIRQDYALRPDLQISAVFHPTLLNYDNGTVAMVRAA